MTEEWKDILGYEGRYQISNLGRVKSLPFMQRYVLRNRLENFRLTKEHILKTQIGRHGYELVSLSLDNVRTGRSVHSLVAEAFVEGSGETINHKDGVKHHNTADNMEWVSYSENHNHAVDLGLNKQAVVVVSPRTGIKYPSINRARTAEHVAHRVASTWAI